MRIMKSVAVVLSLAVLLLAASRVDSWAGGLFLSEISGKEIGLASAGWAARAQDASTVFTNPAGMTRLPQSELQLNVMPAYLHLNFSPDNNTSTVGDSGDGSAWMPLGSAYYVHSFSPQLKAGLGMIGYFGLAIDYSDTWVGRYYVKKETLQGFTVTPAVAYQVTDWLSIGAGLTMMYAMMEDNVGINTLGGVDGGLKLKDDAVGWGGNFGILLTPAKGTRFGVQYLSQMTLDFKDTPEFTNLGPIGAALANAGLLTKPLNLGVTVPQAVMVSAYQDLTDNWALMANFGWQEWSKFGKVEVQITSATPKSLTTSLDFNDTWHVALGTQVRVADPVLLSFGVAYDSAMQDEITRSPSIPTGKTVRLGVGGQYAYSKDITLGLSYEMALSGDLKMDVNRGPLAGRVAGEYNNAQMHFIGLNLDWKL